MSPEHTIIHPYMKPHRTERENTQPHEINKHMRIVLNEINTATSEQRLTTILQSAILHINGGTQEAANVNTGDSNLDHAIKNLAGNNRHNCISRYFCGKDYTRGITVVLGAIALKKAFLYQPATSEQFLHNQPTPDFINQKLNEYINSINNQTATDEITLTGRNEKKDINIKLDKNYLDLITVTGNDFITIKDYKSNYFHYHLKDPTQHMGVQRSGSDYTLSKQLGREEIQTAIINKLASDLQATKNNAANSNINIGTSSNAPNYNNSELGDTLNPCFYHEGYEKINHTFTKGNRQVIIQQHVDETKGDDINIVISYYLKQPLNNDELIIIPYGIKPSFPHEAHSIFVVIYNQKVFIVDSKPSFLHSYKAIHQDKIELSTHFQSITDRTNCGRYTIHTAIELAKEFLEGKSKVFDVKETIHALKAPNLKYLQTALYTIFRSGITNEADSTNQCSVFQSIED